MRRAITSSTFGESMIVVNGVSYTQSEYKKYLKEKGKIKSAPKKKKKVVPTEIQLDGLEIGVLVKGVKLLKSFDAYYHNAYRQWGKEVKEVLFENKEIGGQFIKFVSKYKEIESLMSIIEKVSGKSEKAVYQYIETMGYKVDDIIEILTNLSKAISKNDICQRFNNRKFIFENGRRLGLKELMSRVCRGLIDMQSIIIKCGAYGKKGIDPFEYTTKSLNGMLSCWSGNER